MANRQAVSHVTPGTGVTPPAASAGQLQPELERYEALFHGQPKTVQRFLEAQAGPLAHAYIARLPQARFTLPDHVVIEAPTKGEGGPVRVPPESREQVVGGLVDRLTRGDVRDAIRLRLAELEQSEAASVSTSAGLIRHAAAMYMVHGMLPAGHSVTYVAAEGEGIPSLPVGDGLEPDSAITATTDAIAEEGQQEAGRGELLVPYVPAARRFYLPQWVAFDDEDRLLVGTANEAEAHIASMQRYLGILHAAVSLAPHVIADEDYQTKRHGMLGQLVNQGRALARYQTKEIIRTIKHRAAANDLNRGLSLSLPYFDDQSLEIDTLHIQVIPAGRIMFVPAFVVRAAREEQVKVAQDTRLNASTRKYLLDELVLLERAFDVPPSGRRAATRIG